MSLKQIKEFTRMRLDEERAEDKSKVFTVRFNVDELKTLDEAARYLEQDQLGTVIKQLVSLGLLVLHDRKTKAALDILFKNERNNKRRGVTIVEPTFSRM